MLKAITPHDESVIEFARVDITRGVKIMQAMGYEVSPSSYIVHSSLKSWQPCSATGGFYQTSNGYWVTGEVGEKSRFGGPHDRFSDTGKAWLLGELEAQISRYLASNPQDPVLVTTPSGVQHLTGLDVDLQVLDMPDVRYDSFFEKPRLSAANVFFG